MEKGFPVSHEDLKTIWGWRRAYLNGWASGAQAVARVTAAGALLPLPSGSRPKAWSAYTLGYQSAVYSAWGK